MKNVMKKAHEITKKIIRKGDSYRETFRLALSFAHSLVKKGVERMIEYKTSKGAKVEVSLNKIGEVERLTINGKVIVEKVSKYGCYINAIDNTIRIVAEDLKAKLFANVPSGQDLIIEANKEVMSIHKKRVAEKIEEDKKKAYKCTDSKVNFYTIEEHMTDINSF